MSELRIDIELSPEDFVILKSMGDFYFRGDKDADRMTIEMALEYLAANAKMVTETTIASIARAKEGSRNGSVEQNNRNQNNEY